MSHVWPFGYDAATIAVALALVAVGVLMQMKAPSVVGTAALVADVVVVVFDEVRWSEVPFAVYSIAVGGVLFGAGWALLYRREQLTRMRDDLRARREAFAQWR